MSDFDSHDHTCEINPNRSGSKADCSACGVIATEVADYEKYMEDRKAGKFDVSRIPTAELEALREASLRYAAKILNMAEKLDVGVEGLIPAIGVLRAKAEAGKLDTARLNFALNHCTVERWNSFQRSLDVIGTRKEIDAAMNKAPNV